MDEALALGIYFGVHAAETVNFCFLDGHDARQAITLHYYNHIGIDVGKMEGR